MAGVGPGAGGQGRAEALSHGWPCNPIGNLRRVSLCRLSVTGHVPPCSLSRIREERNTRATPRSNAAIAGPIEAHPAAAADLPSTRVACECTSNNASNAPPRGLIRSAATGCYGLILSREVSRLSLRDAERTTGCRDILVPFSLLLSVLLLFLQRFCSITLPLRSRG